MTPATRKYLRIGVMTAWALYLAYLAVQHGIDRWTLGLLGLFAIWGSSAYLVETRLSRPAQTYGYLALLSSVVAAAFIAMPVASHGDPTMGAIAWAGMTMLGLVWCIYYEWTAQAR